MCPHGYEICHLSTLNLIFIFRKKISTSGIHKSDTQSNNEYLIERCFIFVKYIFKYFENISKMKDKTQFNIRVYFACLWFSLTIV